MGGEPQRVFAGQAFGQIRIARLERFNDVHVIDDGALAASRRVSELVCCGGHVRKEQVVKLRDLEGRRVSVRA